jgi:diphthine-ammonia ligase
MDVVVSWSGGKDSALALWRARAMVKRPIALLTMLDETGQRSRSHGLPVEVLEAQATSIGVPLVTAAATWDEYTDVFVRALSSLAGPSVRGCVFGDIDIEPHRQWCVKAAADAGLEARHPLWLEPRRALLQELFDNGFHATIVVLREPSLDPLTLLGHVLTPAIVEEIAAAVLDASGETGEYHTVVTAGPIFTSAVPLSFGAPSRRRDHWAVDVRLMATLPPNSVGH